MQPLPHPAWRRGMAAETIRFDDGAGYERSMGVWSRLAGEAFLDWLSPAAGLRWLDVGCGNGAFTEALVQRCAPASVHGIDPSRGQLDYARERPGAAGAEFVLGDAMDLPFEAGQFDAAAMALVLFFVPDPARAVAEMRRTVRGGGQVAAYVWDFPAGGFPFEPVHAQLRALGVMPALPPHPGVSRIEALRALWQGAGLEAVDTREITVERRFVDFADFWGSITVATSLRGLLDRLSPHELMALKDRLRASLRRDEADGIVCGAKANAIRGRVPG